MTEEQKRLNEAAKRVGQKCPTCDHILTEKDYPERPWYVYHEYWLCCTCWPKFERDWGSGWNPVNGSTIGLTEWVDAHQKGYGEAFVQERKLEATKLRSEKNTQ